MAPSSIFHTLFKLIIIVALVFCIYKMWRSAPPFSRIYELERWWHALLWALCAACVCLAFLVYCYLRRGENLFAIILKRVFPKLIPVIGQVMLVTDFVQCITTNPDEPA